MKPQRLTNDSDGDDDIDNDSCPICLGAFQRQKLGQPESCNHTFCLQCIVEWAKNINTCPIDRTAFQKILVRSCVGGPVLKKVIVEDRTNVHSEEEDEVPVLCQVCSQGDRPDRLLLCDGCDEGYHLECLQPPLDSVPLEEWYCPSCEDQVQQSDSELEGDTATDMDVVRQNNHDSEDRDSLESDEGEEVTDGDDDEEVVVEYGSEDEDDMAPLYDESLNSPGSDCASTDSKSDSARSPAPISRKRQGDSDSHTSSGAFGPGRANGRSNTSKGSSFGKRQKQRSKKKPRRKRRRVTKQMTGSSRSGPKARRGARRRRRTRVPNRKPRGGRAAMTGPSSSRHTVTYDRTLHPSTSKAATSTRGLRCQPNMAQVRIRIQRLLEVASQGVDVRGMLRKQQHARRRIRNRQSRGQVPAEFGGPDSSSLKSLHLFGNRYNLDSPTPRDDDEEEVSTPAQRRTSPSSSDTKVGSEDPPASTDILSRICSDLDILASQDVTILRDGSLKKKVLGMPSVALPKTSPKDQAFSQRLSWDCPPSGSAPSLIHLSGNTGGGRLSVCSGAQAVPFSGFGNVSSHQPCSGSMSWKPPTNPQPCSGSMSRKPPTNPQPCSGSEPKKKPAHPQPTTSIQNKVHGDTSIPMSAGSSPASVYTDMSVWSSVNGGLPSSLPSYRSVSITSTCTSSPNGPSVLKSFDHQGSFCSSKNMKSLMSTSEGILAFGTDDRSIPPTYLVPSSSSGVSSADVPVTMHLGLVPCQPKANAILSASPFRRHCHYSTSIHQQLTALAGPSVGFLNDSSHTVPGFSGSHAPVPDLDCPAANSSSRPNISVGIGPCLDASPRYPYHVTHQGFSTMVSSQSACPLDFQGKKVEFTHPNPTSGIGPTWSAMSNERLGQSESSVPTVGVSDTRQQHSPVAETPGSLFSQGQTSYCWQTTGRDPLGQDRNQTILQESTRGRVSSIAKAVMRPLYKSKQLDSSEYKRLMKAVVDKVCKSGKTVHEEKVKRFVEEYVRFSMSSSRSSVSVRK